MKVLPSVFPALQLLYICMVELATQKVWFFPQTSSPLTFKALKGGGLQTRAPIYLVYILTFLRVPKIYRSELLIAAVSLELNKLHVMNMFLLLSLSYHNAAALIDWSGVCKLLEEVWRDRFFS